VIDVERTLQQALRAGVLVRSFERDPMPPKVGLDLLFRGFIEQRDHELAWNGQGTFDRAAFDRTARELLAATAGMGDETRGTRSSTSISRRSNSRGAIPTLSPSCPVIARAIVSTIASSARSLMRSGTLLTYRSRTRRPTATSRG